MTRLAFMGELESLLSDIPIEERNEALQYYNDYFQDAGEDHEEEILKELVSPQRIAGIIKAELDSNATDRENRGYFTEKGYQDTIYKDEKFEIVGAARKEDSEKSNTTENTQQGQGQYNQSNAAGGQQQKQKNTNIGLIILLAVFAIPIGIPLIVSFFSVLFAVVVTIFALILGLGIAGISMMGAGAALIIAGLIKIGIPFLGLVLCGSGLVVFGLGMLFTMFTGFLCKKVLPTVVMGIVNLCRLPFRNRSVTA